MKPRRAAMSAARVVFAALLVAIPALAVPTRDSRPPQDVAEGSSRKWWETAVIYQIYPRSFMDSNGDGVGDLKGITSKLDHLKDIGVGAVWLSPIYPSPQADFGYDISNFTDVDPQYGTLDDFDALRKEASELGLKLVMDFVPNHSSDEHEWFKKSVKRVEPYTDYFVWKEGKMVDGKRQPPNNWLSVFRGSAWEFNEERGEYYLHQFATKQPDLNYRNEKLVEEMKEALRFWLKRGVDGFRVDAIPHLFETGFEDEPKSGNTEDTQDHGYLNHIYTTNQKDTYDMVTEWRAVLEEFNSDKIMMTEAYASLQQTLDYYGTPEKPGAHFSFNFRLINEVGRSSKAEDFKKTIDAWMEKMDDFHKPNWVIGNHDQNRVAASTRYGPELADGLSMLALMLPGTAMTYNGEEIAMEDTFIRWDETLDPQAINKGQDGYLAVSRDPERTPFQWDDSTSAGFSTNKKTWLPVNPNYWRLNLAAQKASEHSHYHIYKALIEARKNPTVQSKNYNIDVVGNVLVLSRTLSGSESFFVFINFGSQETTIDLKKYGTDLSVWTASMNSDLKPGEGLKTLNLGPKASVVVSTVPSSQTTAAPTTQSPKPSSSAKLAPISACLAVCLCAAMQVYGLL